MAYLNKAMLIGNIGKDPQTAMTPSGKKRVSFSLATTKRYKDASGEQKEQTTWHNVVLWGGSADTFEKLEIKKGTSLYIEGEITSRNWTDNNGQPRSITEITANVFQILTPRGNGAQHGQGSVFGQGVAQDYQQNLEQQAYASGEDDDLPF